VLHEVRTSDAIQIASREYVFAVLLDVTGNLARVLTELYEVRSATLAELGSAQRGSS